jgi:uncharacterized protein (DUF1501 family)
MRTRRDILRIGALGLAGLTTRDLLAARRRGKAKHCIVVWLQGGPSHLDLFDLKPEAPSEIRGEFRTAKSIDGVYVSEHLPRLAQRMGTLALLRSVTSPEGNHDRATQYLVTGHRPTPAVEYPSLGAVCAKLFGVGGEMPAHVALPKAPDYVSNAGYLGAAFGPYEPSEAAPSISFGRLEGREAMLRKVDELSGAVERTDLVAARDVFFRQAFSLLTSAKAREAFDVSREPAGTQNAYGRHLLGRSCLLARRLIEGGARFVSVVDNGWDTHDSIFKRLRDGFPGKLPGLDQAAAALIDDLDARGLLSETLVVLMGEFGRTPKLNSAGGRDHWPRVNSVVLAGGGARPTVVGTSDAHGELPDERPVRVEDLVATIYALLGIDPATKLEAPGARPLAIVEGEPLKEIL